MEGAIKYTFLRRVPDFWSIENDIIDSLWGIKIAIIGIGSLGLESLESLPVSLISKENSIIESLTVYDDTDFCCRDSEYSNYNHYITEELQKQDFLYCVGNIDDETVLENVCNLSSIFKETAPSNKYSIFVSCGKIEKEYIQRLTYHYDTLIFVDDEKLLLSPFYMLFVEMQKAGFVSLDFSDVMSINKRLTTGYFFEYTRGSVSKLAQLKELLENSMVNNNLGNTKNLIANVQISLSESFYPEELNDIANTFFDYIKEAVWSANISTSLIDGEFQIKLIYGVDNSLQN